MRPSIALAIYLLGVFLAAGLFAPWFYLGSLWLGERIGAGVLTNHPFFRYVGRCFEFFAIAGLFPFLRAMQLRSWSAVGVKRSPDARRDLLAGSALGFLLLGIVALASCWAGVRQFTLQQTAPQILKHIMNASLAAVFASILEELIFRGVLFGGLRQKLAFGPAALWSSGVYALVHFFERPANPAQIDWMSGFVVFGQRLSGFRAF